jgi:GNAT superfamily N-acetyltransferase
MDIRSAHPADQAQLLPLIAAFRVALGQLRGRTPAPDLDAARQELEDYRGQNCPIFVAEDEPGHLVGYLVCRVQGKVVWAESLFVSPAQRRQGIGSALYAQAEALAQHLGGDAPYNWVHPNNDKIIAFLQKRGYNVLNLIELRRAWHGEKPTQKIRVGQHTFDY